MCIQVQSIESFKYLVDLGTDSDPLFVSLWPMAKGNGQMQLRMLSCGRHLVFLRTEIPTAEAEAIKKLYEGKCKAVSNIEVNGDSVKIMD